MDKFKKEVNLLFNEIKSLEKEESKNNNYLLENTYFLNDGKILCKERKLGVSRFPYGKDGFTLWAYSSGYISINESTFYIVLPSEEGKEPYLAFFAGEKQKDGAYVPISLLGRAKNPLEKDSVRRYCVYSKECVYYLAISKNVKYAVRIFVSDQKEVCFNIYARNMKRKSQNIYLSSFMNCLFKYANGESMETKWFKKCSYNDDVFVFDSPEDIDRKTHITNFGVIHRTFCKNEALSVQNTTSRSEYVGGKENSLVNSYPLLKGEFENQKTVTHFSDTAVAGDLIKYELKGNSNISVQYVLQFTHSKKECEEMINKVYTLNDVENMVIKKRKWLKRRENDGLKIEFEEWKNEKVNTKVLNQFIKYVIYQTEYCGLAKNSGALFLGVRDVMQQVEAALMWAPKECKNKIIEAIGFIDSTGNPPRQYSIPPKGGTPMMDLRPFIDQGVWIISTIYAYLSHTGDMSILDVETGYYDRLVEGGVKLSTRRDSVLCHMIQIMDYLIQHIDPKTHCLRAMYGDWNDALDGLGISSDPKKDYGDGVSVMATMQLYKNIKEMRQILSLKGNYEELIDKYQKTARKIEEGLNKFAIVTKDGKNKILHGWGENRSYFVGGFDDVDNQSRDSLTANAFTVISGLFDKLNLTKEDILRAYHNLDSKYGLRTFSPHFEEDVKGVGRIVNLPKGTAENGATYIHGTLFGIMSLFMMDEGEFAYQQLEKILPLTHDILTTSPFVMPNSYSYNVEEGMDGESMSDWYTGSANTLIKTLVHGAFGINADLNGVYIKPCTYFKSKKACCSLKIRNCRITINYCKENLGKRHIYINEKLVEDESLFFDVEYLLSHDKVDVLIED